MERLAHEKAKAAHTHTHRERGRDRYIERVSEKERGREVKRNWRTAHL